MYFTSNDGSRNTFIYKSTLDTLELRKTKVLVIFLHSLKLYGYIIGM